ncbi:MAG: tRNA dihydrouridine synthase DusB [Fimbriimonadaceae bacterium]|nr:tRNA dihydrouridine synthase DusB [Fimbriimonadaceae bacterium]
MPAPPFSVGPVRVDPPVLLAPMEDVSNLPFRLITKEVARPGLMFTEFVSAMAVHYKAAKTFRKLRVDERERPLGIQIFGADPEVMAETARVAEEAGADIVDINMGCWVPKVCRTGSGASLLKDPDLAERIVAAVVSAVKVPVTVKVRAGWDYSVFAAPELAKRFVGAGAQMITLHARFAKQGFEGQADWDLLKRMRDAVTVPFIGNGDVKEPEDALRMVQETGVDGVMVGRAAISDPWRMARIVAAVAGREAPPPPTIDDRVAMARRHMRMMVGYQLGLDDVTQTPDRIDPVDELAALRALRSQLPLYVKGEPGAAALRGRLTVAETMAEIDDLLEGFLDSLKQAV